MITMPTAARTAAAMAFLAALSNLVTLGAVAVYNPGYLRDFTRNTNPDARHYVLLGRNLWLLGHYSRCERPPYVTDVLRTPVYPVVAGGLEVIGRAGAIYLFQGAAHASLCGLLVLVVWPRLGAGAATLGGLFLATDLALVVTNCEAMSETLFMMLVAVGAVCFLPVLARSREGQTIALGRLALGGVALGLATLTRPVGLYLVPLVALAVVATAWRRPGPRRGTVEAAVVLLAPLLMIGPWVVRNAVWFAVPRLTTVDANNLVYFVGAGAYQVAYGLDRARAQERIAFEYGLAPYHVLQNPWEGDQSVAELDQVARRVGREIVSRHPRALAIATCLGMVKAHLSHATGDLAALLGRCWEAPGMVAILQVRPGALARMRANGPVLTTAFLWQLGHTVLVLGAGALGLVVAWRDRAARAFTVGLLALLVYFELTVPLFGLDAYYRCRLPAVPYLDVFAGLGAARAGSWVLAAWRRSRGVTALMGGTT